jgi:hypothetical protein
VRQPAHDDFVAGNRLLPVDRHVLPGLARATGDHQAEGDQFVDVIRPATLDGQLPKVDVVGLAHVFAECCVLDPSRCDVS